MNNNNSTVTDDPALLAWATDYKLYRELENERVKTLPKFQEWAATQMGTDSPWNIEDCTNKWIEHQGFDFPVPPIPLPEWANEAYKVSLASGATEIWADSTIDIGEERTLTLSALTIVNDDGSIVSDLSANFEGFCESLVVNSDEIDAVIAALFKARQFFTGIELAE